MQITKSRIQNIAQSRVLSSLFFIILLILISSNTYSACTPASAELCIASDDWSDAYLNGVYIDRFPYCDIGDAGCQPQCNTLTGAQLALLTATDNVISVKNQNTAPDEVWTSWSLDITCSGGDKVFVSSADSGISMYHDDTCDNPATDPAANGGYEWYEPLYDEPTSGVTWGSPVVLTGQKWGKRIFDPATGSLLTALSNVTDTPYTGCGANFFRQGFDLTIDPTPVPPNFTLSKSANPSTNIGQTPPDTVTFTLHICNTGGGTFGNPVNIADDWSSAVDDWQYFWPGNYTDTNLGYIEKTGSGQNANIEFVNGFPANTCYDYAYAVRLYSGVPSYCDVWDNTANLSFMASPTVVATAVVEHYCPPPPNFTIVKTANKTTNVQSGDNITYTITLCNTGGPAYEGTLYIDDDWTSSSDSWQFNGPYYVGGPATGIEFYRTNDTGSNTRQIEVKFRMPGFTGCIDLPLYTRMTTQVGCGPWFNEAVLSYYASPTMVSTVDMENVCTPTFTPTPTRTHTPTRTYTYTRTYTNTPTDTPPVSNTPTNTYTRTPTNTYTFTSTPTPTFTFTSTPTPLPIMNVNKTANVAVASVGDMITFTLAYNNPGTVTANDVQLWDTIPAAMGYVSCSNSCYLVGNIIVWNLGNVGAGGSGSVTWWGTIDAMPMNPLFGIETIFAYNGEETVPLLYSYYDRRFMRIRQE